MDLYCERFSLPIVNEIVKTFLGQEIGRGTYRTVFNHHADDSLVIKVANHDCGENFANALEWMAWVKVQYWTTGEKDWLAPCIEISPHGQVLIQKKTEPIRLEELRRLCPRLPAWLATDLKAKNWGMLNGRPVCHDYGNHLAIEKGATNRRMVKARWPEA